ncbi:hypothetical protein D3C81_1215730 [compost metagenome]
MPPSAALNRPGLSSTAPVKLPFLWPKNSLSISSEGMAPQLTGTNGCSVRGPSSWISRATSSLPLPDSPLMYTGAWLRDSLAICLRRARIGGESPSRRLSTEPSPSSWGLRRRRAVATSSRRRARSTGLVRKSKAPALRALIAVSRLL